MLKSIGLKSSSALKGGTALRFVTDISKRHFRGSSEIELLDVGCGAGHFLRSLPPIFRGTGVDYNGLAAQSVNISYERLPFPDSSFDIATAWQVLEHLENPFFAGREIHRVLRPEGIFIFSVPNIKHIRTRMHFFLSGGILRWNKRNDHLFVPLEAVLKKRLFQGFCMINRVYADGPAILPAHFLFAKNEYWVLQKD
ncbi:MAG: hypothetical protein A3C08_03190 [Candidatus Taylorbacteria bacterium RIFCSPHIGHO2_02_FULL_47_18]|uniref:Methyltransferase type 11 domain-containing protein n=1 Tax=Candidatus Taylorbacteria bacterium RIFCSPLOWO2_01_FULL_48_100 TaxID=1802322 RepID=A0A1G2NGG1_9BACT|nr:MAG: hypothetical protein A3C08_03190 [Candidatus Taylorbacteria bacterium RIFCSPHIGHO2_02_FULL_47_18]OHA35154.1 MAG: hypothetical protein A2938_01955 [Candidatus Taylorbacteria bacterium RIFCSPLOWO2_01_FULL_48_100]OHA41067.1 MAG: hypothetical protein A3J31_03205 [Candidatus Taylorbacteria bacterium RIFCSPLOWO2_02_FULL_48_16]OHA45664.1 MAG: hypothetical protein A3H13_00165 [Candidatus Taylorbacteria bacterium RIFCSPLOWO2_12_FULL_48_11]